MYAIIDVESTTFKKGNPYADRNRLCYVGIRIRGVNDIFRIDGFGEPYGEQLAAIRELLRDCTLIVGFNLKFDLAWLKRYGIDFSHCRVWDCQLGEFLLSNQSQSFPSLGATCARLGLGTKSDAINDGYWSKGIDTPDIPRKELELYLANDLEITDKLYNWQLRNIPRNRLPLFNLQNEDLLVLLEMEFNGTKFNVGRMQSESATTAQAMARIQDQLAQYSGHWPHFNWNSGDHLSALLYGGTISVDVPTQYEHVYKSGPKVGQTALKNRWETVQKEYPRLYEPIEGSELKKADTWSTDASFLRQLKGELPKLLLEYSDLEKWKSTYLDGIPKLLQEMDWQDGYCHGTFNQCVVITGRLSSEKPNLQNMPEEMNVFIETRMPE